jgi:hypothetical protein
VGTPPRLKNHELAGLERKRSANRIERELDDARAQPADGADRVVVGRNDVARQQLALEVGGHADRADGDEQARVSTHATVAAEPQSRPVLEA